MIRQKFRGESIIFDCFWFFWWCFFRQFSSFFCWWKIMDVFTGFGSMSDIWSGQIWRLARPNWDGCTSYLRLDQFQVGRARRPILNKMIYFKKGKTHPSYTSPTSMARSGFRTKTPLLAAHHCVTVSRRNRDWLWTNDVTVVFEKQHRRAVTEML